METDKRLNRIIAIIIFLISFIVYFKTIAPTTSFWDCGEFIACSYILGVPHPPGSPLYLIVGRVFTLIPWASDIGLRVNIISAITTAITIMFTYLIIVQLVKLWRGAPKSLEDKIILYASGIVGSLALAFSDSVWFNAVEAEVYAVSLFFTSIIIWLILLWHEKADDPHSDKYILMIAYCIGLAIGIHLLNILAIPAIGLIIYFRKIKISGGTFLMLIVLSALASFSIYPGIVKWLPNLALKLSAWLFLFVVVALLLATYYSIRYKNRIATTIVLSLFLIILGTSTYGVVYIRSNLNPAIDENDPENLANLVSYLNREQYGDWSYTDRRAPFWEYQIKKMYIRYLGWQFIGQGKTLGPDRFIAETISLNGLYALPFLLGVFGFAHHFFKDYKRALAILVLFLMTGIAIVLYLNQPDPQPRERDYVYVGSFFAFAIWIGIGTAGLLETIHDFIKDKFLLWRRIGIIGAVVLAMIAVPFNMLRANYHSHDRSGNYVAYDYSYNILQSCEKDAIVFTNGDNDTFPLWFLQYVKGIRLDVRVVNLSLLNTNWYIKQLKHEEPKAPISLSDAEIDNLNIRLWPEKKVIKIPVPQDAYQQDIAELGERKSLIVPVADPPEISFELEAPYDTPYGKAIRVQDWMVLNIIAANQFKKPIYFAVTVSPENMLNLDDYLRMDGLCYKLVTYPGEQISPTRLKKNLFETFQYRNLNNPDVYYDINIIDLLGNYRAAFLRIAGHFQQEKMYPEMIETLDKMEQVIPEEIIPVPDKRLSLTIGNMYKDAGKPEEFERRLNKFLQVPNISPDEKLEYAQIFYQYLKNKQKSEEIALEIIEQNPNYLRAYYWLFNLYANTKNYEKGIELSNKLLAINPGDMQAKVRLEQFQKLAAQDSSTPLLK